MKNQNHQIQEQKIPALNSYPHSFCEFGNWVRVDVLLMWVGSQTGSCGGERLSWAIRIGEWKRGRNDKVVELQVWRFGGRD